MCRNIIQLCPAWTPNIHRATHSFCCSVSPNTSSVCSHSQAPYGFMRHRRRGQTVHRRDISGTQTNGKLRKNSTNRNKRTGGILRGFTSCQLRCSMQRVQIWVIWESLPVHAPVSLIIQQAVKNQMIAIWNSTLSSTCPKNTPMTYSHDQTPSQSPYLWLGASGRTTT
jgi:hypothetical protein